MLSRRHLLLLLLAVLVAVAGSAMPGFSSASFTAQTLNSARVTAAADWTPPTVSVLSPGSTVKDTVTVTADANDAETGVADVTIQYLPVGGTSWVTICTVATAPYGCAWSTKAVADGGYDLRARATDRAGYATVSETVRTTVANNVLVVLGDPGDFVRGTVSLPTTIHNPGTVSYAVRVEYSPAGANSWKSVCTNLSSPYSCSWATTGFTNDYYDLRAVAVSGSTTHTSAVVTDVLVDNLAPTVTMTDPGSPLRGTHTFAATAADAHSGVAQVVLQYAAAGSSTYKNLCTITTEPYSCRFDTTTLLDGTYTVRAVATDFAGHTTTSALVTNRVVDNTVSSVSMEDPGAFLAGTVPLAASANSTAGVASVRIQRAANGTTSWTDVCTDSTAPFSCSWDSRAVVDGLYDFRAVLVDGNGRVTTSATVAARRVDNSPLRGVDVQTTNGGVNAGRLEAGDSISFTYSEQVDLATVSPGWAGGAVAVSLRLRDGNLLGLGGRGDTVDVLRSGSAVNLGSVNLREDYIKNSKTSTAAATMTATTVTVNGVPRTVVTIQLGAVTGLANLRTTTVASTMAWTPLATVRNAAGDACSAATANETGVSDWEF